MSNPAETYESYMVPAFFEPWASHLIRLAAPQPGERVLDVACGTGIVARRVAPLVGPAGEVAAIDFSPHMLAVARRAAAGEGLSITWLEGRAEELPFQESRFDVVLCQAALMFFSDRRAALANMHRVLEKKGRLALSVLQGIERHPFYATLHSSIERRLGASAVQEIFALGDPDRLRSLMAEAGFDRVEVDPISVTARFPDPESFLAGEIDVDTASIPSMQALDAEGRRAILEAIREDMEQPLREVTHGDRVVMAFHTHIARARRDGGAT